MSIFLIASLMAFSGSAYAETKHVPPGDCRTVQTAISQLPPQGGVVQLGPGEYVCDHPIVINRDNIVLQGMGSKKTHVRSGDGLAMPVIVIGEPETYDNYPIRATYNITLQAMTVAGSLYTHTDPFNNECYDFVYMQSTACANGDAHLVRNNGITVRAAHNILIFDVETYAHLSGGIVLEKKSSHVLIDGFKSYDNYFDGFAGYETFDCTVRNFELRNNQYSGISVDIAFEGNIFEDGIVADNLDNGIFSAQVGKNIYRNLSVRNNKKFGFYFDGSHQKLPNGTSVFVPNTCDNNKIQNTTISGGISGVYVNHTCQNMILENLTIIQSNKNCVSYYPGSLVHEINMTCKEV